jgi:hypothetical protein
MIHRSDERAANDVNEHTGRETQTQRPRVHLTAHVVDRTQNLDDDRAAHRAGGKPRQSTIENILKRCEV